MKFKAAFLAFLLLTCGVNLSAQNFNWAKSLGGTVTDMPFKVIVDANGYVYTCGYFNGTADFDPGPGVYNLISSGVRDCFISKLDSAGNFVWAVKFGGTGADDMNDIAFSGGNIVAVGSFENTVDFDPGAGTTNLSAIGATDLFIISLDAGGNLLLVKQMGGAGSTAEGIELATFGTDYYVLGRYTLTIDVDPGIGTTNITSAGAADFFICKLDGAGNFSWVKTIGGTGSDNGQDMKVDPSGSVIYTAYFSNTVDFDPGPGVFNLTAGSAVYAVGKLDPSGNFVWAYLAGCTIKDLHIDVSGNFYLTGSFIGTIDFDLGPGVSNMTSLGGYADIFIAKYDNSGNLIWAKHMGSSNVLGDEGESVITDLQGNVYTTGGFSATSDFDPGPGTFNLVAFGSGDAFISKLDSVGNFVWAGKLSGTNFETGLSITVDPLGDNIFATGRYQSATVDFDAGAGVFNMTPVGGTDVFIVKYANCSAAPTTPGSITGSTDVCTGSTSTYTVTPVNGATTYTWTLPSGWTGTSTSNSINATAGATSGNITVTANNACGSSSTQTLSVTVTNGVPLAPTSISGASPICEGSTNNYSVAAVAGATSYTWTLPGGWSGSSNSNSITATSNAASGTITVTANNTCGSSSATTLSITVNGLPNVSLNLTADTLCSSSSAFTLSGGLPLGGTFSGTAVSGGNFGPALAGTGVHIIVYTFTDSNSCVNVANDSVVVDACLGVIENENELLSIFPNPTDGMLNIISTAPYGTINIYSACGKLVFTTPVENEITTINLSEFESGIYFAQIITGDGIVTAKVTKE